MGQDFTVTITDPQRAAELPGRPAAPVYMLDLSLITDEQRHALIRYIADKFQIPIGEVAVTLDMHGVPILAEHCLVTVEHPQKWF